MNRNRWTKEEENSLLFLIEFYEIDGIEKGINQASIKLDRTEAACIQRYQRLKRLDKIEVIELKTSPLKVEGNKDLIGLTAQSVFEYIRSLESKIGYLLSELEKEKKQGSEVSTEFSKLLNMMEIARKMAFASDNENPKFKMDNNGNLERIG